MIVSSQKFTSNSQRACTRQALNSGNPVLLNSRAVYPLPKKQKGKQSGKEPARNLLNQTS